MDVIIDVLKNPSKEMWYSVASSGDPAVTFDNLWNWIDAHRDAIIAKARALESDIDLEEYCEWKADFIKHTSEQCQVIALVERGEFNVSKEIEYEEAKKIARGELSEIGFDTITEVEEDCICTFSWFNCDKNWKFIGFNRIEYINKFLELKQKYHWS